jgi:hypothetical protein
MKKMTILALLCALYFTVLADDVTEQIETAASLYKTGKFSKAAEELNFAVKMIRSKQIQSITAQLPKNYKEFSGEDAQESSADASFFGGGIEVSKNYYDSNSNNLKITILAESPLVSSFAAIYSNPFMMSAQQVEKIKQYKATVDFRDNSGDVKFLLDDNKTMITISGSGITKQQLLDFAKAIDYTKIEESIK